VKAKLVMGRSVDLKARDAGLPLPSTQGAVGVRIEMGTIRVCTRFDGDAVRRDVAGHFVGRNADAPDIDTCSDDALLGVPQIACEQSPDCTGICAGGGGCGRSLGSCVCVAPGKPCGDSEPACNGDCPAGETCSNVGGVPFTDCACLPTGSTGCGTVYPSCSDGDCPAGTSCYTSYFECCGGAVIGGCGCSAEPPEPPCGGACPEGWTCAFLGMGPPSCIPPLCNGGSGAPACDGACGGSGTCHTIGGTCVCVETCSGGGAYPTCGGTCSTPNTQCLAVSGAGTDGECLCGPSS
jgi:hypothetical protein